MSSIFPSRWIRNSAVKFPTSWSHHFNPPFSPKSWWWWWRLIDWLIDCKLCGFWSHVVPCGQFFSPFSDSFLPTCLPACLLPLCLLASTTCFAVCLSVHWYWCRCMWIWWGDGCSVWHHRDSRFTGRCGALTSLDFGCSPKRAGRLWLLVLVAVLTTPGFLCCNNVFHVKGALSGRMCLSRDTFDRENVQPRPGCEPSRVLNPAWFGLLDVRPDSDSKPKPPQLDLRNNTKDARTSKEI